MTLRIVEGGRVTTDQQRWPDTGRFRSAFQAQSWLWFWERSGQPMHYNGAKRELAR